MDPIEQRTVAKVSRRIVPFLMLCYFVAYLDRVNVGFAALTMNKALGISSTAYGFGAGIFFFSYFLFEVPSNLALERFGARKWIARIMMSWGILSGAMALISGETSFYVVRVLLGIAEAGFFPGIIFYLTLWFPGVYRARIVGWFMAAIPLSSVSRRTGVRVDSRPGRRRWLGRLAMAVHPGGGTRDHPVRRGLVLPDRPPRRRTLAGTGGTRLARPAPGGRNPRRSRTCTVLASLQALFNPKVLALSLVYFGAVATNYGTAFWLPQIVKGFGLSNLAVGFVSAVPYIVGTVGMIAWSRSSDARMERKGHAAHRRSWSPRVGIAGSTLVDDPTLKMIALSIGAFGVFAVLPVFWTFPTAFLSGAAAAAGIAAINSIGNLAGFFGPFIMGWLKDVTGSFSAGLWAIAACAVVGNGDRAGVEARHNPGGSAQGNECRGLNGRTSFPPDGRSPHAAHPIARGRRGLQKPTLAAHVLRRSLER